MVSADFSFGIDGRCRPSARIAPRPKEISQGKTLILRSVAVGFTCARVRLAFGHPRLLPGYPTAPAFYPVPVRQLRALLPASSPPRLSTTQLPSAIGSCQSARRGLSPPRSTSCLAHNENGGTMAAVSMIDGSVSIARRGVSLVSSEHATASRRPSPNWWAGLERSFP